MRPLKQSKANQPRSPMLNRARGLPSIMLLTKEAAFAKSGCFRLLLPSDGVILLLDMRGKKIVFPHSGLPRPAIGDAGSPHQFTPMSGAPGAPAVAEDSLNTACRTRTLSRYRVPLQLPLNLLTFGILGLALFAQAAPPEVNPHRLLSPISLKASTTGRFGEGSWHLSVSSSGQAHLMIDTYPKPKTREFNISPEQINQLAEIAERERFFALKADYGELVPDGSTDTITIVRGDETHTVSIHFLMNWVHSAPSKLKEPARAVRVFQVVRGWFDDKDAVNLKKYDDMVLEAAGKGG
jgi:hypothetical protein